MPSMKVVGVQIGRTAAKLLPQGLDSLAELLCKHKHQGVAIHQGMQTYLHTCTHACGHMYKEIGPQGDRNICIYAHMHVHTFTRLMGI